MLRRLVLLLIILGLGIAACGGDDDEDKSDDSNNRNSASTQATPTLPFSVDLVLWHPFNDQRAEALANVVEQFNNEYSGSVSISTEYHTAENIKSDFEAAFRSGGGPDILVADQQQLAQFLDQRLIYPIDESVVNIMQSDFPLTIFQSFFYHDQVMAVPLWADMLVLYTNLGLVNPAPTTIDELIAIADTRPFVLYPGVEGTAGLYSDSTDTFFVSLDGDLILFKQSFVNYLKLYRRLLGTEGITFSDDPTGFMNGEVGGLVGFASDYQQFHDVLGDDLYVSILPLNNQAYWQTFARLTPLVISQNAPDSNITAANLFFAYLLAPDIQVQLAIQAKRIPLITSSDADLDSVTRVGLQQLQWASAMSPYPLFDDTVLPEMNAILSQVSASSTDSDLDALADQFFAIIQG